MAGRRAVRLRFESLVPAEYQLTISAQIESDDGLALAAPVTVKVERRDR